MEDILTLRAEINAIDREIVRLFQARMDVSRRVGLYKIDKGLPVLDEKREAELLEEKVKMLSNKNLEEDTKALFETIMDRSRRLQGAMVPMLAEKEDCLRICKNLIHMKSSDTSGKQIIYQGQPGAYGEVASMSYFGENCARTNMKSWEGVFRAVKEGFGDYGVVPVENSSTGAINAAYDLLGKFNCYIVGEVQVPVNHCLMAGKDATVGSIETVYSHEQGFLQCKNFLEEHPKWQQIETTNTALSAKLVAQSPENSIAAIASVRAAELYDLQILRTYINDNPSNYTRFIIVARTPMISDTADKISVTFSVNHTKGSLCRILQVFASEGLNLLKLESRPDTQINWEYQFFADYTGNLGEKSMEHAIGQLIEATETFRILGNYKAATL